MSRKSKSKTEIAAPSVPAGWAQRLALFGPPPLLEGEDAAAYDQLLARTCSVVKPVNIVDEIYIADAVYSEWEFLRYLRLHLDYGLYSEQFANNLAEILQDNLPEDESDSAQTLARACARDEADAVDKVDEVLAGIGLDMDKVLDDAKSHKAKELVQGYARREADAVTLVHELLTCAGVSMDNFMADALAKKLDDIERIDRVITIAKSRRDASLREIDRRRAVLGEPLRRSLQEIENGEFEVIDPTPAEGKNPA